jgi:hypothetical protein
VRAKAGPTSRHGAQGVDGLRSAVRSHCSAVAAAAVDTVGYAAGAQVLLALLVALLALLVALLALLVAYAPDTRGCRAAPRRRPCRGGHRRLAQVASVSGAGLALLVIGNCLPPFVIPALLAFACRSPPFRKCHMLPCLLATMVVFPLFLHIFIHVLYLTCFQHLCALAHLDRAYHVSGSAPMSPRHILPRFFFRILSPLHALDPLLYISLHPLLWEFPTFSSTVSSDNMFREISTLRRAARHDAAVLPLNLSNRFERLSSLQVRPDIYACISDDG